MSLQQVSEVTGGRLTGPPMPADMMISGLVVDSRRDCGGKMFVALRGPNFDGHDFVGKASDNGAVAAMLEHETGTRIPMVVVGNALASLGSTAAWWRDQFEIPVVGITGSVGKTTVKEMLGAILSQQGKGIVTEANLNNEIGVPLTLTRLAGDHCFAVVEMGMNHAGEISRLSRISKPTVAVINNAAAAHLEGLGSIKAVAAAKAEILDGLPDSGIVVLNADDDWFDYWKELAGSKRVISFGLAAGADITASYSALGVHSEMNVAAPGMDLDICLLLPGRHNICNALAAISAAVALDVPADIISLGLESCTSAAGRLGVSTIGGVTVIDDTYNANPASMAAAIEVLKNYPGKRRALVIGDMGELGGAGPEAHRAVGEIASASDIDRVYAFGPLSALAVMSCTSPATHYDDKSQLATDLQAWVKRGDVILVKGSRSMAMEEIVVAIGRMADSDVQTAGQQGGDGDVA